MELFITDRRRLTGLTMPEGADCSPHDVLDRRAIPQGMPFILAADGGYDVRLNQWLASLPNNNVFARNSWSAYARDLLIWIRWLSEHCDGKTIWTADDEDFRAFYFARCHSEDPAERIVESSWKRQRSTLVAFYESAVARGYVARNPCRNRGGRGRRRKTRLGLPTSTTSPPAKHLSIPAYLLFREVGMQGRRGAASGRAPAFRRNGNRNAAAANLAVSTGARLEELSLILKPQLPSGPLDPADNGVEIKLDRQTTKGSRERSLLLPVRYLREIQDYVEIERSVAVSKAQQSGRYRDLNWTRVRVERDRILDGSRSYPLARLDGDERMRLFIESEAGGEPAALWLNEAGLPMGYEGWKSVMKSASGACSRAGHTLYATWHTLRHTFAVHTLACILELVFGEHAVDFDPTKAGHQALMLGPLEELKRRMGHSDFRTTWDWYLANAEPARRLVGRAVEEFVGEIAALDSPERLIRQ